MEICATDILIGGELATAARISFSDCIDVYRGRMTEPDWRSMVLPWPPLITVSATSACLSA